MAANQDEAFLDAALKMGVITQRQYADALRALKLIAEAGVQKSAASILVDKGYATPEALERARLALGGADQAPAPMDRPPDEVDFGALDQLSEEEPAQTAMQRGPLPAPKPAAKPARPAQVAQPPPAEPCVDSGALSGLAAEGDAGKAAPARRPRPMSAQRQVWLARGLIAAVVIVGLLVIYGVAKAVVSQVGTAVTASFESDLRKAEEEIKRGHSELALGMLERISRTGGEVGRRAEELAKGLRDQMSQAEALYRQGLEKAKAGDHPGAIKAFEEVIAKYPNAGRWPGYAKGDLGRSKIALFQDLTSKGAEAEKGFRWSEAAGLYAQAEALAAEGQSAAARLKETREKADALDKALKAGEAAAGRGAWQEARASYAQALVLAPGHDGAIAGLSAAVAKLPKPKDMVFVPPGFATVGSNDGEPDEAPQRQVFFGGVYVDRTEVTNEQYAAFLKATQRSAPPHWKDGKFAAGAEAQAVVCVSWDEAKAYAEWAGKRLPTSLEWEAVARGAKGRRYPWGDAFDASWANLGLFPADAGAMPKDRTPEGVMDMGGGVSEWTEDACPGSGTEEMRVVRGASWVGMEAGRPSHALLRMGDGAAQPDRMIVVDNPQHPVAAIDYPVDRTFTFLSVSMGKPLFRYYVWLPEIGGFDPRSQSFQTGELICFQIERHRSRDGQPMQFDTGYTLVEFSEAEKVVVIRNASGATRRMKATGPADPFGPLPRRSGAAQGDFPAPRPDFRTGSRVPPSLASPPGDALGAAPAGAEPGGPVRISQAARSSNILRAPKDSRLLNLGFRCVKDF